MSVDDMRKKYPGVAENYLQMLSGFQEFVNKEIMPRRRDLDGGPYHRDAELAERTFNELTQKLIDIDGVRGQFPVEVGGAGLGGFEFWVPAEEELSRGDCGLTLHMTLASWAMMAALLGG
ncbi:MAG: acyl-CoA dehydrogenase family protein, partial [Chloroflexi bacterium]|nr:acyl-CoA dehydrogenase family protein [Chloroflexota bacterium]